MAETMLAGSFGGVGILEIKERPVPKITQDDWVLIKCTSSAQRDSMKTSCVRDLGYTGGDGIRVRERGREFPELPGRGFAQMPHLCGVDG